MAAGQHYNHYSLFLLSIQTVYNDSTVKYMPVCLLCTHTFNEFSLSINKLPNHSMATSYEMTSIKETNKKMSILIKRVESKYGKPSNSSNNRKWRKCLKLSVLKVDAQIIATTQQSMDNQLHTKDNCRR